MHISKRNVPKRGLYLITNDKFLERAFHSYQSWYHLPLSMQQYFHLNICNVIYKYAQDFKFVLVALHDIYGKLMRIVYPPSFDGHFTGIMITV